MALYAFDGTGNEDRGVNEHGHDLDSNVLDFFRGYSDPNANDDPKKEIGSLYLQGIGTRARTRFGEKLSMAFGVGGHKRIRDAMERLENNFERGDMDVDVIGFSRGAALAISFCNELHKRFPQISIRFCGVWDIVGQFGAPGKKVNAGHDLSMPKNVENLYHAMALDETRALFPLTRLGPSKGKAPAGLREVWFRGVHSDVGGGNGNPGMNWISLHWMFENARRHSLPVTQQAIEKNQKDGRDLNGKLLPQLISDHKIDLQRKRSILTGDVLHLSVAFQPDPNGRLHNNPPTGLKLSRIDDLGTLSKPATV